MISRAQASLRHGAKSLFRTVGILWRRHCDRFDADPFYRLLVTVAAEVLARQIEPAQALWWLRNLLASLINRAGI